jgi:hypothetical protein
MPHRKARRAQRATASPGMPHRRGYPMRRGMPACERGVLLLLLRSDQLRERIAALWRLKANQPSNATARSGPTWRCRKRRRRPRVPLSIHSCLREYRGYPSSTSSSGPWYRTSSSEWSESDKSDSPSEASSASFSPTTSTTCTRATRKHATHDLQHATCSARSLACESAHARGRARGRAYVRAWTRARVRARRRMSSAAPLHA